MGTSPGSDDSDINADTVAQGKCACFFTLSFWNGWHSSNSSEMVWNPVTAQDVSCVFRLFEWNDSLSGVSGGAVAS